MKRVVGLALVLSLLFCAACAEAGGAFTLKFDEGFSLTLPAGWVSYPPTEGARYILGDGAGGRYLYIQAEPARYESFESMQDAIARRDHCQTTSALDLDGQRFAAFIADDLNASGCATLLNGEMLMFLFTPQDDPDYMLEVAGIMAGFRLR